MKILYLFGPNLGALGTREPETYGTETLDQIMAAVTERGRAMEHDVSWRQSDHEGELIGWFLGARADGIDAIVVNPGALTPLLVRATRRDRGLRDSRSSRCT